MAEVPLLGQSAARERAAEALEVAVEPEVAEFLGENVQAPIEATTAFIVAWIQGQVIPITDLNAPITIDHPPTADEIAGAGAILMKDRTAEEAATTAAQIIVPSVVESVMTNFVEMQKQAMQRIQGGQATAEVQKALAAERRRG